MIPAHALEATAYFHVSLMMGTARDRFLASMKHVCTTLLHTSIMQAKLGDSCYCTKTSYFSQADTRQTAQTKTSCSPSGIDTSCSPSDVVHLLLLADVDLEVCVALVNTNNLVLIDLVARPTEELASLLNALQGIGGHLSLLVSSQGPILSGGNGA